MLCIGDDYEVGGSTVFEGSSCKLDMVKVKDLDGNYGDETRLCKQDYVIDFNLVRVGLLVDGMEPSHSVVVLDSNNGIKAFFRIQVLVLNIFLRHEFRFMSGMLVMLSIQLQSMTRLDTPFSDEIYFKSCCLKLILLLVSVVLFGSKQLFRL